MKMQLLATRPSFRSLNRLAAFLFVTAICYGMALAQVRLDENGQVDFEPRKKKPISIVIEEGYSTKPILIGYLNGSGYSDSKERPLTKDGIILPIFRSEEPNSVVFNINGNGERFESSNTLVNTIEITNGAIYLPAIKAGFEGGEGIIRVMIDGQNIIEDIRISTIPAGGLNELRAYIDDEHKALIKMGSHYAVVDEAAWTDLPQVTVSEEYDTDGQKIGSSLFGLCIRVAWGPGKVKWNGFNPWSVGKRYSYKPENSSSLKKGSGSGNDVDAVYRNTWGCGSALKVPDSCTLTVNSNGTTSSCCNAAMMALGHKVAWVNPRNHGFPNCPLKP